MSTRAPSPIGRDNAMEDIQNLNTPFKITYYLVNSIN